MSWGIYWMFYHCPDCGKLYKYCWEDLNDRDFGKCPTCGVMGVLDGESRDIDPGKEDTVKRFEPYEPV